MQQNLRDLPNAHTCFNTSLIKIGVDEAIADAGATGHFLLPGTPVIDVMPATKPISINLPDGSVIRSTHTCRLNIPWLPEEATKGHIVPGLAHTSLVSISVLCDAGCRVEYDEGQCRVNYRGRTVWHGGREPSTKLWVLPLKPTKNQYGSHLGKNMQANAVSHQANSAYTMSSKEALIKYLHQCLFCPPKRTLLKAIKNNQLTTWPGLTAKAVERYLPDNAPATDKGHMSRHRKGIRSTRKKEALDKLEKLAVEQCCNPPLVEEKKNQLFGYMVHQDKKTGVMYTDLTGNFPVRSMDGFTCFFVLYDWTTNAILATPMKDAKDESMIKAFKENIEYLGERGFKPTFNIIDNVASKAIRAYLKKEKVGIQLVEPHNHRVNAAERAIRTFKNHFIAGLCIGDRKFPTILWSKLVNQAVRSMNMLRTSRVHPKLSADHVLEGVHDFNRNPWAPPATRATVLNPPESRNSWDQRAIDAWHIGPAWDHYRALTFYIPSTGGTRISADYQLYPEHCEVPKETRMDETVRVAKDLVAAIQKLQDQATQQPGRHTTALAKLAEIFKSKTIEMNPIESQPTQTSNSPTAPANIRKAPRVHLRNTRSNIPGRLPTSEGGQARVTQATPLASSEGGTAEPKQTNENEELATSEGEDGELQSSWYSKDREKRTQRKNNVRRSPRFSKQQNERLDRIEKVTTTISGTERDKEEDEVQPIYGLGIQKQHILNKDSVIIEEEDQHEEYHGPPREKMGFTKGPRSISPRFITQEALNAFAYNSMSNPPAWSPARADIPTPIYGTGNLEHYCAPVIHPTTGKIISKYRELANDPETREVWVRAFGKEFGGLAQGDNLTGEKGTDAIFVMNHDDIRNIPAGKKITYGRIVVDYRSQKDDPNRVRITAGGNLIEYAGEVTTKTADLVTSKVLWNSVVSTKLAKFGKVLVHRHQEFLPMCTNEGIRIHEDAIGHFPRPHCGTI